MTLIAEPTVEVGRSTRPSSRAGILSLFAVPLIFLMALGNPLEVHAASVSYYSAESLNGAWHGSPTVSTVGNAAQVELYWGTVTVDNGQSASSGQGAATQTYSRRSVPVYCKWAINGFPDNKVTLKCQMTT